jgi:hypothetical protein
VSPQDAVGSRRETVVLDHFRRGPGSAGPVPSAGDTFKVRMTAFFVFDAGEELVTRRVS